MKSSYRKYFLPIGLSIILVFVSNFLMAHGLVTSNATMYSIGLSAFALNHLALLAYFIIEFRN